MAIRPPGFSFIRLDQGPIQVTCILCTRGNDADLEWAREAVESYEDADLEVRDAAVDHLRRHLED